MHIFLYEWITGGGLVDDPGRLPASLLAEGSAMIKALAADFAAINGCKVTVLQDARLADLNLNGMEVVEVHSSRDRREEFNRAAEKADWTLVVAPEFDGILRSAVSDARAISDRVLNSSDEFIALAANKHQTAERLRLAGVPAPAGKVLPADAEALPADFEYPGVLKPLDGAGSQHTLLVHGPGDEPPPYPWPRRLERLCPGRTASVAVLCGARRHYPLPACWQNLSSDGRFSYQGGGMIREPDLAARATTLATQTLAALPAARGYVGVDLVLGAAVDGSEDFAIEVNPRLTTSYVGLRAMVEQNLAQTMLDVVNQSAAIQITANDSPLEFSASGAVWRPC